MRKKDLPKWINYSTGNLIKINTRCFLHNIIASNRAAHTKHNTNIIELYIFTILLRLVYGTHTVVIIVILYNKKRIALIILIIVKLNIKFIMYLCYLIPNSKYCINF